MEVLLVYINCPSAAFYLKQGHLGTIYSQCLEVTGDFIENKKYCFVDISNQYFQLNMAEGAQTVVSLP